MRAVEFAILFFGLPALFAFARHRLPALPALWLFAGLCLIVLLRDPSVDRRQLWNAAALPGHLAGILLPFGAVAAFLMLAVRRFAPALFLSLPRTNPVLWVAILLLYPVLSVYPQSIVYRAFLFHRYGGLFGGGVGMVIASAAAFGFLHVVFRNGWAVGLSALAGLLFAARYWQTGSLFVSAFEHALYGCLIFTVGLGRFFYSGAVRRF
ncbi:MAG: CPBP family glutamic-type intramembrane protease [Bryobacteraceae bacterium]|jgi:membrane protease YdiL (CAAX protease family)